MLGSDTFYRIDPGLLADLDRPQSRSAAIARLRAIFTQSMRLAGLRPLLADTRYYHIPYILLGMLRLDAMVEWFFARRRPRPLPPLEPAAVPGPRDVLFNSGDLWWQRKYVSVLIGLQARTGVRIVQMIHDLFVIERPEWFQPGFARLFTGEFEKLAPHVDRWLTNSRFVTGHSRTISSGSPCRCRLSPSCPWAGIVSVMWLQTPVAATRRSSGAMAWPGGLSPCSWAPSNRAKTCPRS
jgi:hypothetical protein